VAGGVGAGVALVLGVPGAGRASVARSVSVLQLARTVRDARDAGPSAITSGSLRGVAPMNDRHVDRHVDVALDDEDEPGMRGGGTLVDELTTS